MKNALVGEGVYVMTSTDWNSVKRLSWPGSTRLSWRLSWPGSRTSYTRRRIEQRRTMRRPGRWGRTLEEALNDGRPRWSFFVRLEHSSTRRLNLLRLSTRTSLAVPPALNRTFCRRRWTRCSHPRLDDCAANWDGLNISTEVWTCWDYLRGTLRPLLRAINWVTITNYDNDSCACNSCTYVNSNINRRLFYHCYTVITWWEYATRYIYIYIYIYMYIYIHIYIYLKNFSLCF